MRRALVGTCASLVLVMGGAAGCEKHLDGTQAYKKMEAEVVAKHRAALTTRLAKLRAVQAAARQHPALSPLQPPASPATADPAFLGFRETEELDHESDPNEHFAGCKFFFGNDTFAKLNGAVGFWAADDVQPGPEDRAKLEKEMTRLETPVYAVVCAQLASEKPSTSGADTFTGGTYKAECRVFEIETAKYLGGWTADVQMFAARVNTRGVVGNDLEKKMRGDVQAEMDTRLRPFGKAPEVDCGW